MTDREKQLTRGRSTQARMSVLMEPLWQGAVQNFPCVCMSWKMDSKNLIGATFSSEEGLLREIHTSSKLSIMGYLFKVRLTDHNPSLQKETATESCSQDRGLTCSLHWHKWYKRPHPSATGRRNSYSIHLLVK